MKMMKTATLEVILADHSAYFDHFHSCENTRAHEVDPSLLILRAAPNTRVGARPRSWNV